MDIKHLRPFGCVGSANISVIFSFSTQRALVFGLFYVNTCNISRPRYCSQRLQPELPQWPIRSSFYPPWVERLLSPRFRLPSSPYFAALPVQLLMNLPNTTQIFKGTRKDDDTHGATAIQYNTAHILKSRKRPVSHTVQQCNTARKVEYRTPYSNPQVPRLLVFVMTTQDCSLKME